MTITIDYSDPAQYVINVPKADMTLLATTPTEIRQLNINDFRQALNDIMDDAADVWASTNHEHTAPLTISGVTLARVVEILDPYVIEFEDLPYNVNVVGGNSNISDKTIKNQVGVNTANSAGLQDPFALQAAAFGMGEVSISTTGATGTTFPKGTRSFPVNNIADALVIAVERGIKTFRILDDFTFSSGDFSDGFSFVGDNPNVICTLNPAANVMNCEFRNLTIQGTLDGANTLRECAVIGINFFNGFIFQCGLAGTITLGGTATSVILQSFSLIAGGGASQYPVIDLGGTEPTDLVVRDWSGGLGIANRSSGTGSTSIDISSGRVVFESTITFGYYTVRGIGEVSDESTGTATVDDRTVNASTELVRKVFLNKAVTTPDSPGAGQKRIDFYDDDQTTIIDSITISVDGNTRTNP